MGSSCGACKFLRRKCVNYCVFAPYFCYDEAATHFAAVHKVFGASNVSKLLLHLPVQNRSDAAITISYEALARMQDPIYGCVAHIFALQQQIASLQEEIDILEHQVANFTVGISSCGSSQTTSNPNCEMQISSLQDAINMQYYQNQSAAQANNSGYVTGNQAFDSQMDAQLSLMHEWEEPNPSCQSHPNPLDRLLEDLDQDIFPFCPWLDSGNTAN